MNDLLYPLRRAVLSERSDGELLDALLTRREEAAFEVLLRRHGPMVFSVCQRMLREVHDAEDAFQATFLVLLGKAPAIRDREALGSWLYGVAYRIARKARALNAKRRLKERQAARWTPPRPDDHEALYEELNALPEKYRVPVVLCDLEGRSRREVAGRLNIPEGTLSSRLATARKRLARCLRRHGEVFAGMPPVATCLPAPLLTATVRTAKRFLVGQGIADLVSAKVIALSEGVVTTMLVTKWKALTAVLVVLGTLGVGTHQVVQRTFAQAPGDPTPEQGSATAAEVQQAAAALAAAKAALERAQADLAVAQAQVAQREAQYREARQRTLSPGDVTPLVRTIAQQFKYRIPVEIGQTYTKHGGHITILEVWGTQPEIKVGGYYLVRGKYQLPSHDHGKLYFYMSASTPLGAAGPVLDLQSTSVHQGQGEFTLLHAMVGPGYFHLQLHGENSGQSEVVADVYFGTGDNVLRKGS
jgi:RNA polymerase sigma factor (sigma-70 family)